MDALNTFTCRFSNDYFCGRTFIFGRSDETIIAAAFTLLDGGHIEGHDHPNEVSWRVTEDGLAFLNTSGHPTTIFDKVEFNDRETIFRGRFLLSHPHEYIHRLVEPRKMAVLPAKISTDNCISTAPQAEVAVLIRAHRADAKLYDLIDKLQRNRDGYDLYLIVDETKGRPTINFDRIVWHSVDSCRALGLTQPHPALLWYCGDFPLYFAMRALPDYRHYVMIEYDVDLVKSDASFMNEVCLRLKDPKWADLDFAALEFYKMTENTGWHSACRKALPERYCYFAYFPIVLVSKSAAAYLFSQRQLEAVRRTPETDIIHCEAFVASHAMAAGFRCVNFNDFIPGCYTLPLAAMQIGSFGGLGKPMGAAIQAPTGVEVLHPIYSHEEFLDRLYRKYIIEGRGDWRGVARILDSEDAACVPEALKTKLRGQIVENLPS